MLVKSLLTLAISQRQNWKARPALLSDLHLTGVRLLKHGKNPLEGFNFDQPRCCLNCLLVSPETTYFGKLLPYCPYCFPKLNNTIFQVDFREYLLGRFLNQAYPYYEMEALACSVIASRQVENLNLPNIIHIVKQNPSDRLTLL